MYYVILYVLCMFQCVFFFIFKCICNCFIKLTLICIYNIFESLCVLSCAIHHDFMFKNDLLYVSPMSYRFYLFGIKINAFFLIQGTPPMGRYYLI